MIGAAQSALQADEAAVEIAEAGSESNFSQYQADCLSIGEAAAELNLPAHVLRYWETQFAGLQPLKRSGGRRLYRPADIAFLKRLRSLLHEQAYTIRGAQRLLAGEGAHADEPVGSPPASLQSMHAALDHAVKAGAFGGEQDMQAGAQALHSADVTARLNDALDLLIEAKARLDTARQRA